MTTATEAAIKPVAQANESVLAQLKGLGFSDNYVESPRRLVVSASGREKVGKTHFALTAPDPIVYFNVDIGTEGVVDKFQKQGKRIYIYDVRVPRESSGKDVWERMWNDLKVRVRKAYEMKSGSVVWDTASEMYELCRLSHFGRLTEVKPSDYTVVNNEWKEIIRVAFDAPINTVFIHKMKAVWRVLPTSSGRTQLTKTNDFEPSGYSDMDYVTQANLVLFREDIAADGETPTHSEFGLVVKDSRHNPNLNGTVLRGPMCDFNFLLTLVHTG